MVSPGRKYLIITGGLLVTIIPMMFASRFQNEWVQLAMVVVPCALGVAIIGMVTNQGLIEPGRFREHLILYAVLLGFAILLAVLGIHF